MPMDVATYQALGLDSVLPSVPKKKDGPWVVPEGDRQYNPCAEAFPDHEVPRGKVFHIEGWSDSQVFKNSSRDIYIYTPANLDQASQAPALAFFNDGALYIDPEGPVGRLMECPSQTGRQLCR